jgi:DNA-binding CsgD family transcriptional regulator/PAS domain-containing protein
MLRQDRDLLRETTRLLRSYSASQGTMGEVTSAIHRLLGGAGTALYSLQARGASTDLETGIVESAGCFVSPARARAVIDRFLTGRGLDVVSYNPLKPEPWQRNRLVQAGSISRRTPYRLRLDAGPRAGLVSHPKANAAAAAGVRFERDVYGKLGVGGHDTLRVLLCEGPSLLGWLGVLQPEVPTTRQREILRALVAPLRARLIVERLLGEATLFGPALSVALEEVPGAAWLLDGVGRVAHANAAGRAMLARDGASLRESLRTARAEGARPPAFRIMPIKVGDRVHGHLAFAPVAPAAPRDGGAVARAAARFGFTPGQTRVLERLAEGFTNAAIAAHLGLAERTVESHITGMLDRAQLASRSALLVTVLRA